jgi:hypothetical protein
MRINRIEDDGKYMFVWQYNHCVSITVFIVRFDSSV